MIKDKDKVLADKVADFIVNAAIEKDGNGVLISELSRGVGSSAKKVNELLWEMHDDFDLYDKEVSHYSNTNMQYYWRMAPAVRPSRKKLISMIKELKGAP